MKPVSNGDQTSKNKSVPASIKRIPPPIPAKFQKEVNQISKYFKHSRSHQDHECIFCARYKEN